VAAEHAPPAQAARDLWAAADVAMAEGEGGVAFALLQASAERAAEAGDTAAQAAALAYAVMIADRFAGNFPAEVPHGLLRGMLGDASRIAPQDDPVTAAYLASAAAWIAQPEKSVSDPALVDDALAAARRTGDPVLPERRPRGAGPVRGRLGGHRRPVRTCLHADPDGRAR
jgi:hypothetical protein